MTSPDSRRSLHRPRHGVLLRALRSLHLALRLGLRAARRWHASYPRWQGQTPAAAVHQPLPPAGQTDGAGGHGPWALAWISRAGPHHLNQDCAGARWLPAVLESDAAAAAAVHHPAAPAPPAASLSALAIPIALTIPTDLIAPTAPIALTALTSQSSRVLALAVADGVTHGAAGDVAALALCQHWLAGPRAGSDRRDFLSAAETAVANALRQHTPEPGAATGAACWLGADGHGWATRVGDCQVLRASFGRGTAAALPAWRVTPLMADQTYALVYPHLHPQRPPGTALNDAEADADAEAQQPARMVGCGSLGEPEWVALHLAPGELLLLASDGLHTALTPADWAAILQRHLDSPSDSQATLPQANATVPAAALQTLVADLLQTAVMRGSEDDITVLAVARGSADPTHPGGANP